VYKVVVGVYPIKKLLHNQGVGAACQGGVFKPFKELEISNTLF